MTQLDKPNTEEAAVCKEIFFSLANLSNLIFSTKIVKALPRFQTIKCSRFKDGQVWYGSQTPFKPDMFFMGLDWV